MKIGLLGQGSIGARHARNLQIMGHEVLAYDPASKILATSREKVIAESEAIIIATPTPQHFQDIVDCCARPLFVEKPLTDGKITLVDHIAMVGYNLRFHKCVIQAKKWIDDGGIGTPLWAWFCCGQFNDKPDYLRDGVCLNWSHEIDLALHLLGPAKVIGAWASSNEDVIDIWLQHDNGARSTIHLDYLTKQEIRESWIVGGKNRIGIDLVGGMISFGKVANQIEGTIDATYVDEMKAFLARIKGEQTPGANGKDGLDVLNICLEAKRMASHV